MSVSNLKKKYQEKVALSYAQGGYVAPIEVMTAEEARALREDYEQAELELAGDPEKLALLQAYPNRL